MRKLTTYLLMEFQKQQGGSIGIVIHCPWFEPYSNSTADNLATDRAQDFLMNWLKFFTFQHLKTNLHDSTYANSFGTWHFANLKYNAGSWIQSSLENILQKWRKFWGLLYQNFQAMTERNWTRDWISLGSIITLVSTSKIAALLCVNLDKEAPGLKV